MKLKLLFLLLLIGIWCPAQTTRILYQLQKKNGANYNKMMMVLDVNSQETKFYDYDFIEMDSLSRKQPGQVFRTNSASDQVIIHNRNTGENSWRTTNDVGDYFSIKSVDPIKWTLEKETKKQEGYTLQKATTKFGGRYWTAWFAKEIQMSEGPYKFRGLPGLIFEIEDREKDFLYHLAKIQKLDNPYDTSQFIETFYDKMPIAISHEQYFKMKLNEYENPFANLADILKSGGKINMNGEDITSAAQLNERLRTYQKSIKTEYNPIERDKAIPYPQK